VTSVEVELTLAFQTSHSPRSSGSDSERYSIVVVKLGST
jgi:hypothetical protein